MLLPQQISAIAAQRGDTVVNPSAGSAPSNEAAAFAKRVGYNPNPGPTVGSQVQNIGNEMGKTLASAGEDVKKNLGTAFSKDATGGEDYGSTVKNFTADLTKRLSSLGHVVGDVAKVTFAPAIHTLSALIPPEIKGDYDKSINWVADKITNNPQILAHLNKINEGLDKNPDLKQALLQDLPGALSLLGAGKAGDLNPEVSATDMKATAGDIAESTKGAASKIKEGFMDNAKTEVPPTDPMAQEGADLDKIQELISPKLSAKETKIAIDEGRVVRGKDSLLFGKKPDVVLPSDEVVQASQTIKRLVPDAHKMTDTELYSTLDNKTGEISQQLKPEMQKVSLKPETVSGAAERWKAVKTAQFDEPEFDDFGGSGKAQMKFENRLNQMNDHSTLDDVWDIRKDYDKSISANVKNANENSAPSLQWQKRMWLENRSILNSIIHDGETGMGEESRQAFSDMSDMYTAKENILSKGKADLKGFNGILPTDLKGWIKAGLGVIGADKLIKATTGVGI